MDDDKRQSSESEARSEQYETDVRPTLIPTPTVSTPGMPATTTNGTAAPARDTAAPAASPLTAEPAKSGGGSLGRPNPPQPPRTRAARKRRSNPWGWIFVVLLGLAAGVGTFFWVRSTQTSTVFQGLTTQATTRQPVTLAVSASGQIQANADVALSFGSSGTVSAVKVKVGDLVKKDQELARLDDTDLQNSVKSAKASLEQSQANLKKVTDGASQKDIEQAQASLKQAQIKYDQTKNGNALPTDINSAQASVRSAQASVGSTQAQLASAQAKLNQDLQGGTAADKIAAQSAISSAEAQLASSKSNLASAQAKLAKDQAGPDFATVTSAQAKVDQAQANLEKSRSSLQSQVVSAQSSRDVALNALRNAQDKYSAAYTNNHNADGSLKSGLKQSEIDNETATYRSLQDAQSNYNKADVALNDAKVALDTGVRSAQSQLDDARAQLDKTKSGVTPADIAADEASIASAQSSVASAQASLDNARKTQAALTPTDATIAADRASIASAQSQLASNDAQIASAQANLAKLNGGTPSDVASAQATVDSSTAVLNDLLAGAKPNDIAVSQAQVNAAQANYDSALAKLKNAVIVAPFDGIVVLPAAANNNATVSAPVIGQAVNASTSVFQLVDYTSLHVDVNVGENDIAKVKLGQAAAVNLDAISGRSFTGKITYISSKSTVTNNVVNYLVTVTIDAPPANTFNDVWGVELAKYFQALTRGAQGQQGAGGRQGAGAGAGGAGGFPGAGAAGGGNQQVRIPAALAAQFGVCGYVPNIGGGNNAAAEQPKVGMSSNVTICQDFKAGNLSVANRAIKTKTENGRRVQYVQVLTDKETSKIEDRPITTGLVGDNNTEITGGKLTENDQIVLSTTPTNRATGAAAIPAVPGGGGGGPGGGGGGRG